MSISLFKALKKTIYLLLVAVLVVGIIAAQLGHSQAADTSIMRVKLSIASTDSFSFSINGNYGISSQPGIYLASGQYTVKLQSGQLKLYSGSSLICSGSSLKIIEFLPPSGTYNYATIKTSKYGTNKYRGDIEFRISGSSIAAINHVYLEYYLYGVVPHEMSDSWPIEALKSQAVAARTYAVRNMGSGTYDIGDTSSDQVYKGYNPSYKNAIKAVDDTAKMVLKCGSEFVQTYYAASNGGYVDIPQHVWSASAAKKPYHITKEDPYDTANAWSVQEVLAFPKTFSGSNGVKYQYMKDGVMIDGSNTFSENALRYFKISALAKVAERGYIAAVSSDIDVLQINRIVAHTYAGNHGLPDYAGKNNCVFYNKADITMTVLANRSATLEEEMETGEAYIGEPVCVTFTVDLSKLDETGGTYRSFNNSSLRLFVVEETQTSWNIYHRRYGHGVGLSQRGTQVQAKQGRTYKQILEFYFPATKFEQLNIAPPVLNPASQPGYETNATIVNCVDYVNVRSAPNTSKPAIGKAFAASRIYVITPFVTPEWHKIDFGGIDAYIFAYYVQIDEPADTPTQPVDPPSPTESLEPEPTNSETPSPTEFPPTQEPGPSGPEKPAISQKGTVSCDTLNVRSGPGTNFSVAGKLKKGADVEIIKAFDTTKWHKIWYAGKECYVSASYIKLENEIVANGIVTASVLNVRKAATTSAPAVGSLSKGAKVEIVTLNVSKDWHKILYNGDCAYVHADYIKVEGQSGGTGQPGGDEPGDDKSDVYATVNANRVNFRQSADLKGKIIKTLSRGDTVLLLKPGSSWHKIKFGGVEGYMYAQYLDVPASVKGKVTASTLNVRSGASTSSTVIGKLPKDSAVEIVKKGAVWHTIKFKSSTAYVYASYIKLQ